MTSRRSFAAGNNTKLVLPSRKTDTPFGPIFEATTADPARKVRTDVMLFLYNDKHGDK